MDSPSPAQHPPTQPPAQIQAGPSWARVVSQSRVPPSGDEMLRSYASAERHPPPNPPASPMSQNVFLWPGFRIRGEDLATCLLLPRHDLEGDGELSHETCIPPELKERLADISPFCKHYMLHLDPENIVSHPKNPKYKRWSCAIPEQPEKQDQLHPDMSPDQMRKSMYYRSCFKTGDISLSDDLGKKAESACRKRDGNKCVVTGRPNPRVFWFIPRGWNDTADHNDAIGNLEVGCYYLTKIDLLENISVSGELGNTHKPWNMICIDPVLYDFLVQGYCAFSYVSTRDLVGSSILNLKFFWMPKLIPRFHQVMDLSKINTFESTPSADGSTSFNIGDNDFGKELSVDLDYFRRLNCPPALELQEIMSEITDFPVISSGHDIWINMTAPEASLFESVAKKHWTCIVFAALCGGAGRAWHLTGMDQRDGSLQLGLPVPE
ncbi:hypothetical protein FAUST_7602 [Fusarium austroamericanum]|uniref:HNH nuclease domain-containing protein n=1 Tax=Fusarium austroamericanum TaxID=282268 RepID=A0AAN5Z6G4_FUSAU|nr:hypothetical protein FAUST_7602 [Fusarium austroamericanum]